MKVFEFENNSGTIGRSRCTHRSDARRSSDLRVHLWRKKRKKDTSWSLERRLAAGVLAEMVENFKGRSIQSDEHIDEIIDSKEHVDTRNWLRNDSDEQVGVTNDSEKLFVDGCDPKSNPS